MSSEVLVSSKGDPAFASLQSARVVMEAAGDREGQLGGAAGSPVEDCLEDFLLLFRDFPFLLPNRFIMASPPLQWQYGSE